MTTISATQVKELRERTGLGMMECKKALVETGGDVDLAITNLRKNSGLKAAKKASRIAAEGLVMVDIQGARGTMIEVNCETDFVARDDSFIAFAKNLLKAAAASEADAAALISGELNKQRETLVQRIGENITLRRVARLQGSCIASYVHSNNKIGVLVALDGQQPDLGHDLAMHIAAFAPMALAPEDVSAGLIAREKDLFAAQAAASGKPPEIVEKMIKGRINKFLAENSLVKQPFVKDPDTTIEAMLKKAGCKIIGFVRYEVGEGIEKPQVDFAAEVRQQAGL